MEPEVPPPFSQDSSNCPCPEPHQSRAHQSTSIQSTPQHSIFLQLSLSWATSIQSTPEHINPEHTRTHQSRAHQSTAYSSNCPCPEPHQSRAHQSTAYSSNCPCPEPYQSRAHLTQHIPPIVPVLSHINPEHTSHSIFLQLSLSWATSIQSTPHTAYS